RSEATITEFSSWGVPGSLLMKPEITAPGGDIYSVNGTHNGEANNPGGSDQYESMSGTSMAAPHIAGLTGVLAEYLREQPIQGRNDELASGYSTRAITQSLLMSTATPMQPGGSYLPILQQGAGLADVSKAVTASSVIMMSETNSGLTGLTGAAADGKVKFEFGDDPARKGDYSYGFTIYNLTDKDLSFDLSTVLFTQGIGQDANGDLLMSRETIGLGADVAYWWAPAEGSTTPVEGHDVDMDGDTDKDDAQAILDYLTYEKEEEDVDLDAADLDGDGLVTSLDAYLLLGWEGEDGPGALADGVVPANGSRYVAVRIQLLEADKADLDELFTGGAYIQGFTYVDCTTSDREGVDYAHTHSIPILGFYGSWTDATMFDTATYTDKLYGSTQSNYSGNDPEKTNYMTVQMNGTAVKFSGNPYMVEEEFPVDRLAINSGTTIQTIAYNLIRAAGTTGFAVSHVDEDGQVTDVISSTVIGNNVSGMWYSQSGGWQGLTTKLYNVNKTPGAYGLAEGDRFRIGFYAIPEYNAMVQNEDYTGAYAGVLNTAGFNAVLESNVLGSGAYMGFDFVVDDTDPQIGDATLNGSQLTVSASDDRALAYVAVMSLDGDVVYSEAAPGTASYSVTFDASDAIANAQGYVAVFAGDYAGNEAAVAVKVNDNTHVEKTVYVRTSTVTAGEEYLIVNSGSSGGGYALNYTLNTSGSTATVATNALTINGGNADTNGQAYIDSKDVSATAVWTAGTGSSNGTYTFNNNGWYLRLSNNNNLTITKDTSRRDWTWDGSNNRLSIKTGTFSTTTRYLRYYSNTFSVNTATNSVYLYQKTVISYDVDPYGVSSVTITPGELDLYKGNTADLTAKVQPLTAADRTVTWSSANTSIAKVDQFGRVTAVAAGSTTIRATANGDATKFAECPVTVTVINKALNGIVWDEEGEVYFSSFNANNLPTWTKSHNTAVGTYLTSAYMFNASTLYAGTLDTSDISTTFYTVNRSTYALTEFSQNFVGAFGVARGPTGFTSYGLNCMVYGFASYLILGNVDPDHEDPDDSNSAMYSGLPYGLLDLTETDVGDAYVAAVCARNVGAQSCGYYFLDETGKIWQTTQSYSNSAGFTFSAPTLVVDTGIGTSFLYQSLYYDGTNLYWTHTTDEDCQLIIIVPSTKQIYNAGNFGEDVWPVAGVYVNGSAAPASVGDELAVESLDLHPVAGYNDLVTADVRARLEAAFGHPISFREELPETGALPEEDELPVISPVEDPAEEPAEEPLPDEGEIGIIAPVEPEPVDEPQDMLGRLTSLHAPGIHFAATGLPAVVRSAEGGEYNEEHESSVTIEIAETEDSHNGLISLAYDPENMTFVDFEVNEDVSITSVHVDDEKGIITMAYANRVSDNAELPVRTAVDDYIEAGTVLVTLNFTVGCLDSEGEVDTLERNEELELDEIEDLVVHGSGHAWGEPTWEWAEDYSSATATFVCENDPEHTETVDAELSSEVVGYERVYTATVVLDGVTYTDTKTVPIAITVTFDAGAGTVDPATLEAVAGAAIGELPTPT
ncbi:MAG: Ig-like domain-containing protein, partial [Oscillospiraceae bacterium]|nr:Ig-like domain-containing protein [Oscillospiraceae bacterium]